MMGRVQVGAGRQTEREQNENGGFYHADILLQRLEICLDLSAATFEKWRQRKLLAEGLHRLIGRKSRPVGGQLEKDSVGFAEVETAKIVSVNLAAVTDAESAQAVGPGVIFIFRRHAERDMMHPAGR